MASITDKIIIGSEDCPISKVTSLLESSPLFHLFDEKWSSIANDLGTPRALIKRLQRKYPDSIDLIDVVSDLVDDWVDENSENATLQEFVRILEKNGLKSCAELLVKGIIKDGKSQKLPTMTASSTTPNIVIGSEGCSISKVVSLLKSAPTFSLFHDNWSYIAMELDTPKTLIKKLRQKFLIDSVNLVDVVGDQATIKELAHILEENDMKDCAEYLTNGFRVNPIDESGNLKERVKKYHRIPQGLKQLLHGNSKFCMLLTLDNQITCDKIKDNVDNCLFLEWKGFQDLISAPLGSTTGVVVVQATTLRNLKQLIKLKNTVEGLTKVIYVTSENEDEVRAVLEKIPDAQFFQDVMSWEDLTPSYQTEITDKLEDNYDLEFEEEITAGQLVVDLINGKTLKLFKDTLPTELSYYVQRRLLSRYIISLRVFELDCPDIFLFTKMTRSELSKLASKKMTDGSGNQIRQAQITVNYLIQEQPYHFDKICGKSQESVHLLCYENGSLRWIRSRGRMTELQKCVAENTSQKQSREEDVCLNSSSEAVCISDSPGMGKSVLLARIGRSLQKSYPDRLVLFIILREFIFHINKSESKDMSEAIEAALNATVCDNVVAKAVLQSKLHSQSENEILIELLLDGFDEMNTSDRKLPVEILQAIRSSFKSVRMWVTTRPHFLHELEDNLSVLGFNIQPFSEDDQVQFLTSFWSSQDSLNVDRVRQFSSHCLDLLKTKTNQMENEIAGIPLQCLLIGEVYKEDVVGYALGNDSSSTEIHLGFATISDLYLRVIEKKLDKYKSASGIENFDKQTIMDMHVRLSLELIFPKQFSKLKHLCHPPVQIAEVLKVGIVESPSGTVESYRFLHRTFAEFFVAWFVTDRMRSGNGWGNELTDFFIRQILKAEPLRDDEAEDDDIDQDDDEAEDDDIDLYEDDDEADDDDIAANDDDDDIDPYVNDDDTDSNDTDDEDNPYYYYEDDGDHEFEFFHPVITYFVDSITASHNSQDRFSSHVVHHLTNQSARSPIRIRRIAHACAFGDLVNIFALLEGMHIFDSHAGEIFNLTFIIYVIEQASLELVKLGMAHFEQHYRFHFFQISMLHAALKSGRHTFVEYLIKEKGLCSIVANITKKSASMLLHLCVAFTKFQPEHIQQRVEIIKMLVDINRQLLEERDNNDRTPLLCPMAHVQLQIELIQLGANVLAQDRNKNTVLNNSWLTPEEYHSLLTHIPENCLKHMVLLRDRGGSTPLNYIMREFDPLPETLSIYQNVGADFNSADDDGVFIFATAVARGRQVETLRILVKHHGCSLDWMGKNGDSLLHIAVSRGRTDALKFLVDECLGDSIVENENELIPLHATRLEINATNTKKQTALHHASLSSYWDGTTVCIYLIDHGADVFAKDDQGNTFLHTYPPSVFSDSNSGFSTLVKSLAKIGKCTLLETKGGEKGSTPFQLAVKKMELRKETISLLHSNGFNFNIADNLGHTVLSYAISGKRTIEFLSILIELGADWKLLDGQNRSMLHISVQEGKVEHVKFFLQLGELDVNGKDCDGNTPLHYAALDKSKNKVDAEAKYRMLTEHGSDPGIINKDGDTPAVLALKEN